MHSSQTRASLEHCRAVLASLDVADDLRELARNLIDSLLYMHDGQRLRAPVFLLALDSLELVPGMESCVGELRATASRERLG